MLPHVVKCGVVLKAGRAAEAIVVIVMVAIVFGKVADHVDLVLSRYKVCLQQSMCTMYASQ